MSAVSLRPALDDDLPFAFKVTEAAMRGYVEQTWGKWDPAQQFENHASSFKIETHSIVLVSEVPAGIVAIEEHADHVQLEKLYLLPSFRNRGIGAEILDRTLQRACDANKPVRLRVLTVNTSATRFYARHGFRVVQETPERLFMESGA